MNNIVYHGTSNGNLEIIKANKSTHNKKCVYATENETVALLFISHSNGDLDTIKMNDNGILTLIERREGVFKQVYNTSGYIYSLPSETFNHYDYLWTNEVISFEDVVPLKKTYYENIYNELIKRNNKDLKMYFYPDRPSFIPLDNSDLIEKYMLYEEKGIDGSLERLLKIYPEFTEIVNKKNNSQIKK